MAERLQHEASLEVANLQQAVNLYAAAVPQQRHGRRPGSARGESGSLSTDDLLQARVKRAPVTRQQAICKNLSGSSQAISPVKRQLLQSRTSGQRPESVARQCEEVLMSGLPLHVAPLRCRALDEFTQEVSADLVSYIMQVVLTVKHCIMERLAVLLGPCSPQLPNLGALIDQQLRTLQARVQGFTITRACFLAWRMSRIGKAAVSYAAELRQSKVQLLRLRSEAQALASGLAQASLERDTEFAMCLQYRCLVKWHHLAVSQQMFRATEMHLQRTEDRRVRDSACRLELYMSMVAHWTGRCEGILMQAILHMWANVLVVKQLSEMSDQWQGEAHAIHATYSCARSRHFDSSRRAVDSRIRLQNKHRAASCLRGWKMLLNLSCIRQGLVKIVHLSANIRCYQLVHTIRAWMLSVFMTRERYSQTTLMQERDAHAHSLQILQAAAAAAAHKRHLSRILTDVLRSWRFLFCAAEWERRATVDRQHLSALHDAQRSQIVCLWGMERELSALRTCWFRWTKVWHVAVNARSDAESRIHRCALWLKIVEDRFTSSLALMCFGGWASAKFESALRTRLSHEQEAHAKIQHQAMVMHHELQIADADKCVRSLHRRMSGYERALLVCIAMRNSDRKRACFGAWLSARHATVAREDTERRADAVLRASTRASDAQHNQILLAWERSLVMCRKSRGMKAWVSALDAARRDAAERAAERGRSAAASLSSNKLMTAWSWEQGIALKRTCFRSWVHHVGVVFEHLEHEKDLEHMLRRFRAGRRDAFLGHAAQWFTIWSTREQVFLVQQHFAAWRCVWHSAARESDEKRLIAERDQAVSSAMDRVLQAAHSAWQRGHEHALKQLSLVGWAEVLNAKALAEKTRRMEEDSHHTLVAHNVRHDRILQAWESRQQVCIKRIYLKCWAYRSVTDKRVAESAAFPKQIEQKLRHAWHTYWHRACLSLKHMCIRSWASALEAIDQSTQLIKAQREATSNWEQLLRAWIFSNASLLKRACWHAWAQALISEVESAEQHRQLQALQQQTTELSERLQFACQKRTRMQQAARQLVTCAGTYLAALRRRCFASWAFALIAVQRGQTQEWHSRYDDRLDGALDAWIRGESGFWGRLCMAHWARLVARNSRTREARGLVDNQASSRREADAWCLRMTNACDRGVSFALKVKCFRAWNCDFQAHKREAQGQAEQCRIQQVQERALTIQSVQYSSLLLAWDQQHLASLKRAGFQIWLQHVVEERTQIEMQEQADTSQQIWRQQSDDRQRLLIACVFDRITVAWDSARCAAIKLKCFLAWEGVLGTQKQILEVDQRTQRSLLEVDQQRAKADDMTSRFSSARLAVCERMSSAWDCGLSRAYLHAWAALLRWRKMELFAEQRSREVATQSRDVQQQISTACASRFQWVLSMWDMDHFLMLKREVFARWGATAKIHLLFVSKSSCSYGRALRAWQHASGKSLKLIALRGWAHTLMNERHALRDTQRELAHQREQDYFQREQDKHELCEAHSAQYERMLNIWSRDQAMFLKRVCMTGWLDVKSKDVHTRLEEQRLSEVHNWALHAWERGLLAVSMKRVCLKGWASVLQFKRRLPHDDVPEQQLFGMLARSRRGASMLRQLHGVIDAAAEETAVAAQARAAGVAAGEAALQSAKLPLNSPAWVEARRARAELEQLQRLTRHLQKGVAPALSYIEAVHGELLAANEVFAEAWAHGCSPRSVDLSTLGPQVTSTMLSRMESASPSPVRWRPPARGDELGIITMQFGSPAPPSPSHSIWRPTPSPAHRPPAREQDLLLNTSARAQDLLNTSARAQETLSAVRPLALTNMSFSPMRAPEAEQQLTTASAGAKHDGHADMYITGARHNYEAMGVLQQSRPAVAALTAPSQSQVAASLHPSLTSSSQVVASLFPALTSSSQVAASPSQVSTLSSSPAPNAKNELADILGNLRNFVGEQRQRRAKNSPRTTTEEKA